MEMGLSEGRKGARGGREGGRAKVEGGRAKGRGEGVENGGRAGNLKTTKTLLLLHQACVCGVTLNWGMRVEFQI